MAERLISLALASQEVLIRFNQPLAFDGIPQTVGELMG